MTEISRSLSGWNLYPRETCKISRPERYRDLKVKPSIIARGQGRSYGDASLNNQGTVILTERLNRILAFDQQAGILQAEAGITLKEILSVIVPKGWFLPVTPGTQFVSLGGCIASDVHGKNHHHVGSFANFLISFELIITDNTVLNCSSTENTQAFWATIGGMGLTGIIGTATIKLKPLTNTQITIHQRAAQNLEQIFQLFNDPLYDDEYSIAWIDGTASGQMLGRSILMTAHHTRNDEITDNSSRIKAFKQINVPFTCPSWLLNNVTVKAFNHFYYKRQARKPNQIVNYKNYFYPLDLITNWNRLYGKNGFIEYQCVIPEENSFIAIKLILEKLTKAKYPSFFGGIKRFGASSRGFLSFPMQGYTLALDIPLKNQALLTLLDELDAIVLQYSGRIYLAKDARLKPENFRAMYPNYQQWLVQKQKLDPHNYFTSSLAKRLQIGY